PGRGRAAGELLQYGEWSKEGAGRGGGTATATRWRKCRGQGQSAGVVERSAGRGDVLRPALAGTAAPLAAVGRAEGPAQCPQPGGGRPQRRCYPGCGEARDAAAHGAGGAAALGAAQA